MATKEDDKELQHLGSRASGFIRRIVSRMRYRRKVQMDVQAELASHFEDEIRDASGENERDERVEKLIAEFGDVEQLAVLLRRAKKRCRPLWAKVIVRSLQCMGLLVLSFVLYTVWFVSGEPHAKIDYVAMVNRMSRPDVLVQDNAWPHYERAAEMLVEPSEQLDKLARSEQFRDFSGLSATELDLVERSLRENAAAWQEFVRGSSKSYFHREYGFHPDCDPEDKWLMSIRMGPLSNIKRLARLGNWRAHRALQEGRVEDAIADCLSVARAGAHWQGRGMLVEQLVGASMSGLALWQIKNIAAQTELSREQLNNLQRQLSEIHADGYPLINIELERFWFHDLVQHVFTDGGPGGGHLVPDRWASMGSALDDVVVPNVRNFMDYLLEGEKPYMVPLYTAVSMVHAGRDATVAKFNEIFEDAASMVKMTPFSVNEQGLDPDVRLGELPHYRYSLIHATMPAMARVGEITFRGKIIYEATLMTLALERWRLDKGDYPGSAGELVEGSYLAEIPIDPFSDKPLVYRKTASGFILYSFGPDFKDDGGKPSVDRKGRPQMWREDGDTVFWPVETR